MGLAIAFAHSFDARDECGGDSAHARNHDAEFPFCRFHGAIIGHRLCFFGGTGAGGKLHFAAGAFRVRQGGLAMLMLACCRCVCELFAMAAPVGVPPVGHEYSRSFLIHDVLSWWRWLVTVTVTKLDIISWPGQSVQVRTDE
jgi:hypothetical protein